MKRVAEVHSKWWKNERKNDQLPFVDKAVDRILENNIDDIKVIINGHRYNLS